MQTTLLRYLRKGTGMWLLDGRAFVVQHWLSSIEEPWVQTDARMRPTGGLEDISDDEWDALLDVDVRQTS